MFRFSAKLPVCASVVRVQVTVLVPEPPNSQHVGVLPDAVSSDGFCSRFVNEFDTLTVIGLVVVALPDVSTARTAIVWAPFVRFRVNQLYVLKPSVSDETTAPS